MAWSGGTFTRVRDWTTDEGGGINIEAVRMDAEDDNFASGINDTLHKGGQNSPTGNLPMGTNRHTGVGDAAAKTDYASAADVIDQHLSFYVDSGAADVYAITPSPSLAAYAEGQRIVFRATNLNTGASTMNANALGAIAIQTVDGSALAAGMIVDGGYYELTYDVNASPDRWVLTSPDSVSRALDTVDIIAGTGMTGGGVISQNRTLNVIGGTGITANADDIATDDSAIVHDNLSGFVAAEHVDWAGAGAENIEAGRSINGALALTSGEVTQLANIGATVISSGDWTAVAALAGTNTGDESAASESAQGIVERATQAEVDAGTDTTRYISPATLENVPGQSLTVVKTADESVVNDTIQDDDHLFVTLVSGKYYEVRLYLHCDSASSTPNIKFAFTTPGASTGSFGSEAPQLNDVHAEATNFGGGSADWNSTLTLGLTLNIPRGVMIRGVILAAATGTFRLRWAQDTTNATATILRQHSCLVCTRLT